MFKSSPLSGAGDPPNADVIASAAADAGSGEGPTETVHLTDVLPMRFREWTQPKIYAGMETAAIV